MPANSIFTLAPDFRIACHNCDERMSVAGFEPFAHVLCANCEADILIPVPFGNYLLEEPAGVGNIASVYRALDYSLDRQVAIKVINPEIAADDEKKQLFLLASQKAATINAPNVVKVFSSGEFEGKTYIATEFMSGGSLENYLNTHGKIKDLELLQKMAVQIATGLSQVHGIGLIYSDFSPNDILLDEELNAKVSDIGFVNLRWEIDNQQANSSFWEYFSPERQHLQELTLLSDIYSFGAILYKMVTAHTPKAGEDFIQPNELNSKITDEFNSFILKLLSPFPQDRYQSMDEILAVLSTIKVNSVSKKSFKVDENINRKINRQPPKKSGGNKVLKFAALLTIGAAAGLGVDYARGEKSALFAEGKPLYPIVEKLKGKKANNLKTNDKAMVISVPEKEILKETTPETVYEAENAAEYLPENGETKVDLSKVLKRPRPKGLDFIQRKTDLQKYVKSFPTKALQDLEKSRIVIIADAKEELSKLMSAHPYQPDGQAVYVLIKSKDNTLIKERCISVKANINEVVVKKPKGKTIDLKWWQVPFQQIITFYDYYLDQRIQMIDGMPTEEHKKMAKQAAIDTAKRVALLADWYGDKKSSLKFCKMTVKLSPNTLKDMKKYLPYQFKK